MAQLRFTLKEHPKGSVTCDDRGHETVHVTYGQSDCAATLTNMQFPDRPDIKCSRSSSGDGVILSAATALRLASLQAQNVVLIFDVQNGSFVSAKVVLPDTLREPSAPPKLDSLLTSMMEDDAIILVPLEETELFDAVIDEAPPQYLPTQFAVEAAEALSTFKRDEDPDSFVLFDHTKFD